MTWAILLITGVIVYAIYRKLHSNQTTYFTKRFGIKPGHTIEVYINGVKQQEGADYAEIDGIIIFDNLD